MLALLVQISFAQQKKVTGTVTDASTGEPLPGVNVLVKGTSNGTVTDFDGKFSIMATPDDVLVFSYVGYQDKEVKVGNQNVINVQLQSGEQLEAVVLDITGEKKEVKTLSYAVQNVKAEKLAISDISNVESALAGKVAGAQVLDQAGSKLGFAPKVRIRGRISLTTDSDPLYIVDGVPVTNPSFIDPDNIASVEVLKGPNATAIYGQRGENGVVVITTKKAKAGNFGVEINSKISFENVAYLPKYQNEYGQGTVGDLDWGTFSIGATETFYNPFTDSFTPATYWAVYPEWNNPEFQGANFIKNTLYDESWGPKFDGREYMPWYAWFPDSPYLGQKAKWEAQPNNIKDFFDTGVYVKNNFSVYSSGDKYNARVSFTNLNQKGIIPYSKYKRNYITANLNYDISSKTKVGFNVNYSKFDRLGDFNDDYANQSSGSFNQWFARQINMKKMRELIDLKTPEGYHASWNWWGPSYLGWLPFLKDDFVKLAFWFNPYTWMREYKNERNGNQLAGSISFEHKITDHLKAKILVSRMQEHSYENFKLPFFLAYSSQRLFTPLSNSFGIDNWRFTEDNYNLYLIYKNDLSENINVDLLGGSTLRSLRFDRERQWMDYENDENYLIIPDVYRFDNTTQPVTTVFQKRRKKVFSLFGKATIGYKDLLFLEATARQDWSSALFPEKNGYFYPSVGLTYNFTSMESFQNNEKLSEILTFGKLRIGWAQVGSDVRAHLIYPRYPFLSVPHQGYATLVTPNYMVDHNLKPAINSSFETGFDLEFYDNKYRLSFTYYYEKRKDEIIFQTITGATGYSRFLTNGGQSHRSGIELSAGANIVKTEDFNWNLDVNFNKNKTIVDVVPGGSEEMVAPGGRWWSDGDTWGRVTLVHVEHKEWGQLKGYDIKRDENGNPVLNPSGYYIPEEVYFGSVLPKFTGGFTNVFDYKNFKLAAHFTFQKGGKFYSGSEIWGYYSGLYEETAVGGNRDNGVDVEGVDGSGNSFSTNVPAKNYFKQFADNDIAGPFIHDASYLKLRELSLTYQLPKKVLGKYLKGATISVIGTNVWLISVSKDNYHRWDPSELSQTYGEDGQLPGTRRIGMNIKLTF